jgi:hypothetical protein
VELMFRKLGKKITKDIGIYYEDGFKELKKMDVRVFPELYEKMWTEKVGVYDVVLLTKCSYYKLIELAEMYITLFVDRIDDVIKHRIRYRYG